MTKHSDAGQSMFCACFDEVRRPRHDEVLHWLLIEDAKQMAGSSSLPRTVDQSYFKVELDVKEVREGVYVYDLGQNIVGVPRIKFDNGEAGRRVTVRVSEMLYPDLPASGANVGMITTENYRAALSQDEYLMKAGEQTFQPRFTASLACPSSRTRAVSDCASSYSIWRWRTTW